jgi:hypothetical protein
MGCSALLAVGVSAPAPILLTDRPNMNKVAMKYSRQTLPCFLSVIAAACAFASSSASAAILITEVDPAGSSSTSGYAADWFEVTNTGSSAVSIAGWSMDDNHDSFSAAVALTGVSSIAAGQTVVFVESTGTTAAAVDAAFESTWFGSSVPAGFTIGNYSGGNVGLSQSGDAVNLYNSSGAVMADVVFGSSSPTSGTFDNTAGLNGVTLTTYSKVGVDGAFLSKNGEIGSPGIDTAVSTVPLPATAWLMMGGLLAMTYVARRNRHN